MSKLSKIFSDVPIDIPNRSAKDLSHENLGSLPVGTLVPVLCEQVNPNETFDLGYLMRLELPPMATNFFGRLDCRLEAFFVPNRIIWAGWKDFWTQPVTSPYDSLPPRPTALPNITVTGLDQSVFDTILGPGTLADYLGLKVRNNTSVTSFKFRNILPFLAYHKIYDDWYRNNMIQKPVFSPSFGSGSLAFAPYRSNPFSPSNQTADFNPSYSGAFDSSNINLGDGYSLFSLRQRNYAKDYFTTASLYPDSANGSQLKFNVDSDNGTGQFSIGALRAANTLQRWLDRNNIAGFRYSDQIRAQFGILPSDAAMDRALFLGSSKFGVYNNSVSQTVPGEAGSSPSPNPFGGALGSKGGQSNGMNDGQLINNFTATEHGYIIVLASLVPHAYYGTGARRHTQMMYPSDFPVPLLQGLGEQSIYKFEVSDDLTLSQGEIDGVLTAPTFGYSPQYSWAKFHEDEVHGELRDSGSLKSFALKRSFDNSVALNTSFIQIPKTALDEVLAFPEAGNFAWYDMYLNFKKVDTLSDYVIPTLGDLKNTHKEEIPFRGRQL